MPTYEEDKDRTNKITDNVSITAESPMYLEELNTLGNTQNYSSIWQALEANQDTTMTHNKIECRQSQLTLHINNSNL